MKEKNYDVNVKLIEIQEYFLLLLKEPNISDIQKLYIQKGLMMIVDLRADLI